MVAAAAVVVAVGTATGMMSAAGDGRGVDEARPAVSSSARPEPPPAVPSPSPSATGSASPTAGPKERASPKASASGAGTERRAAPVSARLYRHPASQVLDWVRAHPDDPRRAVIESRIADRPAAVWFADHSPDTITSRVRAVASGGAAQGRVPVLVPYAVPDRDCGGHSQGGAPDPAAYDAWIDRFAAGLGDSEAIVILEPDAIAQSECLSAGQRAARFASLARAGRVLKEAGPRVRVYYDAGHSGWRAPAEQAALLRQAGAASAASSDGIFSNVSNFHATADEIAYDRAVLDALGGPPGLGAYLWVKLPGESDGCTGAPGTFTPLYAYDLAR
ncbi:glycoside hydrolase family 6 protein [Streptomyces caelestis]|uniref:glycoside hydrolase family 6 protein n=1 Tax=Streptomyces caelestis TaxID=36816 RepID=UPI00366599C5